MSRRTAAALLALLSPGTTWAQEVMQLPERLPPIYSMDEGLSFGMGGGEPFGAEDASAEDDVPRIPEPMVFDLVRPLGARRGEFEINVLGIVPIGQVPGNTIPNALGLSGNQFEWAPEVEYAFRDNWAIEFELPFDTTTLAAYKSAGQITFGTAFNDRFIHGAQVIVQYDRHPASWLPTFLYIAGVRIDSTWSFLGMIGVRGDTGAFHRAERVQRLLNLTLFADITNYATIGLETNLAVAMSGNSSLMVMPQLHWEITDYFMIQAGAGGEFTGEGSMGQAAFRVIRSF